MRLELNRETIIEGVIILVLAGLIVFIGNQIWRNRKAILVFLRRLRLTFLPLNFNIVLAIQFKEGLNSGNYFDQIKTDLEEQINTCGLNKVIKVKDYSELKIFKSHKEAESFRSEKGIDLLIWGKFTNDFLKEKGDYISKIDLKFTFGLPQSKDNNLAKLLVLDINSRFAKRSYWTIFESNSLNDVKDISNELFNISTYILAISLKFLGKVKKSLVLFEKLHSDLSEKKDMMAEKIIPHIINCLTVLSLEYGLGKKDYKPAIDYCKRILHYDKNHFGAKVNLALFLFRIGETLEAGQFVEELKCKYPKDPITIVDVAFFRILQKDYDRALRNYLKLRKINGINFNPQEVIEFLDDQYTETNEPALLFASGFISYYYGDRIAAKEDFKRFRQEGVHRDYTDMRVEAGRLIREYDSQPEL